MSGITATGRAPREIEVTWPLGCSLDGTTQEPKPCEASLCASLLLCVGTTVCLVTSFRLICYALLATSP